MNNAIICYIGLGSNLDNPIQQVQSGLLALNQIYDTKLLKHSSLYTSKPLEPYSEHPHYINAVAELKTSLSAQQLLQALQKIEINQGRKRKTRWEPRILDLDLLLYGTHTLNEPGIKIPHPEMHNRDFVLYPLSEIAPHLQLPNGTFLKTLLSSCLNTELKSL